jgi:EAL domain-containing protein (putative c-di-GMP-specific phosphodiesterase class I)/GGDEF domain-containing protein
MIRPNADLSDIALIRQAILSAQRNTKQAALLLIGFDQVPRPTSNTDNFNIFMLDEMAARLRGFLRDSDLVVQVDDDHLAVLLLSVTAPDDAVLVALKIIKTLTQPLDIDGDRLEISPQIGIALPPDHTTNADTWISHAATALKLAKQTRQSYSVYAEETITEHAPLRMGDLRHAIVADQLFLLYQPKIQLQEGTISGLEVLSRWQHPEFGIISPNEFIPVAERTGLIIPLTLWVLHQSLLQCRAWQEMGLDINIAVNLSMWNLEEQQFPNQLQALLRDIGISPERLELEITESAIMVDPQQVMQTLRYIKDLGVRFTIDDFGTGYSSLAYLKKLPVSGIKIDKSFVQNMELDRDNAVIVRSIVDLGHNLGLNVVAEGVETYDSNEMLKAFQCDEAQGFYYSRPIPGYAITDFLKYPAMIFDTHPTFESRSVSKIPREKSNAHGIREFSSHAKRA